MCVCVCVCVSYSEGRPPGLKDRGGAVVPQSSEAVRANASAIWWGASRTGLLL